MKKFALILTTILMFSGAARADRDRIITVDQLPAKAQTFVKTHFADLTLSYVKEDADIFDISYEVVFSQGTKVEFDSKGEWKDIDCKYSTIDEKFVPEKIILHVRAQWPDAKFVQIERGRRGYEVKLTNGLELTFDTRFNLVDIDD